MENVFGVEFGAVGGPLRFFPDVDAVAARAGKVAGLGQRDDVRGLEGWWLGTMRAAAAARPAGRVGGSVGRPATTQNSSLALRASPDYSSAFRFERAVRFGSPTRERG